MQNGSCVLELSQVAPSTVSGHAPASSGDAGSSMQVPDCAKFIADFSNGLVPAHDTNNNLNKTAINHHINFCNGTMVFSVEYLGHGTISFNRDSLLGCSKSRRERRAKVAVKRSRP